MKRIVVLLFIFSSFQTFAQRWELEVFTGASVYRGDLDEKIIDIKTIRPAVNLNLKYKLNDQLYLRGGLAWGMVAGNDQNNKDSSLINRNLSFSSHLAEVSFCAEYLPLSPELYDIAYPYFFAGIGFFHFNPSAKDNNNEKVFLQPLGTEGQGLSLYPTRKKYSRTQICIPLGGGMTFVINEKLKFSTEIGFRKLFTDYLDDVSSTYVDLNALEEGSGKKSAEMSYRGTYIENYEKPIQGGSIRGNAKKKDWYYFAGVKFSLTL